MYFKFIFPTKITCVPYCFEGMNHIFIYFLLKPSFNLLCSNCAHIYTDDFNDNKFYLIYTDSYSSSIYCTFSQSMKWTEEHEGIDAYATMAAQERNQ